MATVAAVAPCPDCGRAINLWPLLQVGEELNCPHCEADLVVVGLDPVEFDWADLSSAGDDDWDDDWDDNWDDEEDDR